MAVRVFKIGDSGNGDQRHPVIPDATGHALDRARRRKRKQKPIDVQPIEPEESEAVPAETPGYFYEEAVEYEDEFPELETTDSYSTESPADEEEDEVLEEHLESEDMEPDDSLPSELLPSDDIESPNPEVVNRISEESDLHIQGNGLEQPSIEEPITDATAHSDALPGDGLTESPYWQPRAFWLTVSGAIGQAEQGDFDTFRQRLRDEGFSEWEIGRHVELFEQQGADGYLQDPISRESPVAIASAQPRVRQEALEQLKDYGVEGGYDLAAAVAAGVDENTILQAGFSPSHYYDATNFSEQPLSASQVDSFREDLKSAGFSTEDIETRLKLLQSMGAEEYTRVMGELNALGLNSTAGPVTPVEIDNFRDKLQAEGFSDEEIDTRLKLLQSMGAEEYTRVMGELNALGLNSTAGPVTPVEIDNFRDKLQAEGFSDEEIDTRVKLLQSMGAEEYTRVMGKLNALKLPSARVPESAGLEAFSRDLKTLGYLGEYSEAELDERWRVFQSVGRGWDKYLETSVANDPPLELVPELRRIQEETNEAFATAWAMGLGQKKLEFEQLAETYSQRSAGYSPFLEARTKLGLSDISDLEALKESRWKEGRSEGFPDLVTPLLEGRWKDKIVEDKFSGTPEEFEQFQREYETALEGSWQGTMPEVVSYLAKKLEEAELLTPDLVPAIEVALEHAERVNRLEPSFGMTGAGTAILVSSLALPLRFPLFLLKGFAKFGIRPSAKVLERMIGSEGWRDLSGALRLTHDPLTGRAFGPSPLGNLSENAKRVIADALNWPVASVEDRVATLAVGTKSLASEAYRLAERQALSARQWAAAHTFDDEASIAFRLWQGELKRDVAAGRVTQEVANRRVADAGVALAGMRDLVAASGKSPDWASIKLTLDVGRLIAGGSGKWTYPTTIPRVSTPGTVPKPGGAPWLFPGSTPQVHPVFDPSRMPQVEPGRTPLVEPTPTTPLVEPTPDTPSPGRTPLVEPTPTTPLVEPTPDTPSPGRTPLVEPTPTTPLDEPTPDDPPPERIREDEPTPRIGRPKEDEIIEDDKLPSVVVDIADETELGERTDTSPAPLPVRPSPADETTRRPPAPWRPRAPLRPPSFEMPSGDALPAGEFPRRVEVIAGFNRKVIDLYTGAVEDYLMPKGQFTNPLKPSFKVLSTGSSRPKRRTLNLGTLQLTVSGSGVEVAPLHARMRGSGLRTRLRPRMRR